MTWCWGDAKSNSFMALKVAMATAPVLRLPDFEKQFVVTTDASDVEIGAILEQDSAPVYSLWPLQAENWIRPKYAIQRMSGNY